MKKITKILTVLSVVCLFAVADASAQQIVIRARLHAPGMVRRPFRPSPRHVWVAEEWTPAGGTYVYHAGYWSLPPRQGAIWIAGHWRDTRGGYVWIPGHWR